MTTSRLLRATNLNSLPNCLMQNWLPVQIFSYYNYIAKILAAGYFSRGTNYNSRIFLPSTQSTRNQLELEKYVFVCASQRRMFEREEAGCRVAAIVSQLQTRICTAVRVYYFLSTRRALSQF